MPISNLRLLEEPHAVRILGDYGIPYPSNRFAKTREEAIQGAEELGYPVALKIVSPQVIHKSDAGGVTVGLRNADEVGLGFVNMVGRVKKAIPEGQIRGVLVCREAHPGLEIIVGALADPVFGPTLMFGLGGIFTEVMRDVSFRVAPVKRVDVEEMIEEIKGYPVLAGLRGQRPRDLKALANLILAVSRLVSERPEIKELDLNPVRLYERGLMVLDARIMAQQM
ncbi:MAG: acetate--CoA ligase family protein [Thermodesulfobacteriota bacterium]